MPFDARSDSGCKLRFCECRSEKTQWRFQGALTDDKKFVCGRQTVVKHTHKATQAD